MYKKCHYNIRYAEDKARRKTEMQINKWNRIYTCIQNPHLKREIIKALVVMDWLLNSTEYLGNGLSEYFEYVGMV